MADATMGPEDWQGAAAERPAVNAGGVPPLFCLHINCKYANISDMANKGPAGPARPRKRRASGRPSPVLRLSSPEQVRAYAHPVRLAILSLLAGEPLTLSQAARRMDVHPANLSRHFRLLERTGLILLVEKRETGRNLEKYYRAAALSFAPDAEGLGPAGRREAALGVLRDELSAAMRWVPAEAPEADLIVLMSAARVAAADRARFYERLRALEREFVSKGRPGGDAYCIGLALFPTMRGPEGDREVLITEGEGNERKQGDGRRLHDRRSGDGARPVRGG
jgi:DNA-binding transcriptional ArsR family regulator